MDNNILDQLNKDPKAPCNITLDQSVLDDLNNFKSKNKIKKLSPMINVILRDWLKQESKKKNKSSKEIKDTPKDKKKSVLDEPEIDMGDNSFGIK